MRIALVGPVYPYRGGIAHYTTQLANSLQASGHDLLLVSFSRQYPPWLYPGRNDRDPSAASVVPEDAHYWIDSLNPLTWLRTFWRIRAFNPDRLVLQWWTLFWAPLWLVFGLLNRLLLHKRMLYICHNVQPHEKQGGIRLLSRLVLSLGDLCVVHSSEEARFLQRLVPATDVTVRHLPVFELFSAGGQSQEEARADLGLPSGAPVFLFFGIVRPYKGLQDLVDAFPLVRRDLSDALLVVAGDFWEPRSEYERRIEALGIADAVRLDDRYIPDDELQRYLIAADLVVAPYRSVTGSAVVQTARGLGVPVIATRVGSLMELAEEDPGITLVNCGDEADLAKTMIERLRSLRIETQPLPKPLRSRWCGVVEVIEDGFIEVERLRTVDA